jgi:hypothetical protein
MVYYRYAWKVGWILLTEGKGQFWKLQELVARNSEAQTGCPILNLVWIPRYGALGASWATAISYSVSGIFYLLLISKMRPMDSQGLRIAIQPLLLSLAIVYGLRAFPIAFWWKLIISGAVYAAGAWILGIINRTDIDRLRGMLVRKPSNAG